MLSRVLFLLASFWQGGVEYFRVVEDLRNRELFWKLLAACASFDDSTTLLSKLGAVNPVDSVKLRLSKQDMFTYAHQYRCEATVHTILAHDIFLQRHLIYSADAKTEEAGDRLSSPAKPFVIKESGALEIVQTWRGLLKSKDVLHAYTHTLLDRDLLYRAKVSCVRWLFHCRRCPFFFFFVDSGCDLLFQLETRIMVVGLMGKVISGHDRGLNSALVGRIRHATMQVWGMVLLCTG